MSIRSLRRWLLLVLLACFVVAALARSQSVTSAGERQPHFVSLDASRPVAPDRYSQAEREALMREAAANMWRYAADPNAPKPAAEPVAAENGQVVYVSADRTALWLMGPAAEGQRVLVGGLTAASGPIWSHDSRSVAFAAERDGYRCVFKLNLQAPSPVALDCGFVDIGDLEWSPDDNRLVGLGAKHPDSAWHAWVVSITGGPGVELAPSLPQTSSPTWLDNATVIVPGMVSTDVWQLHRIKLAQPQQAVSITPSFGCSSDCTCNAGGGWLAFSQVSPNRSWIAFVGGETISTGKNSCTGYYHVYVMSAAGGTPQKTVEIANTGSGQAIASTLRWASDSQRVVVGGSEGDAVLRVQVVNTATNDRLVLNEIEGDPWYGWGWAPDATRVAVGHAWGGDPAVFSVSLSDSWSHMAVGREPDWGTLPLPPSTDVIAAAMQVTQATQTEAADVPFVEGKRTFVRVTARDQTESLPGVQAELTVTRDGVAHAVLPLANSLTVKQAGSSPLEDDLKDPSATFNFEIPLELTSGSIQLRARLTTPSNRIEQDLNNNAVPPITSPAQTVTFNDRAPLVVATWRMTIVKEGKEYKVDQDQTRAAQDWFAGVYPVTVSELSFVDQGALPTSYTMPKGAWSLSDICNLRDALLQACATSKTNARLCYGWLNDKAWTSGYMGCAGSLTVKQDGVWKTYRGAVGLVGRPQVTAHEAGHTLDRNHVRGCGALPDFDDKVPEFGRLKPDVGFMAWTPSDVQTFWANGTDPTCPSSGDKHDSYYDLMGYSGVNNNHQWVLPYTYKQLYDKLAPQAAAAADAVHTAAAGDATAPALVVSGVLRGDGQLELAPLAPIDLPAGALLPGSGRYRLELRAADGRVLAATNFDPTGEGYGESSPDRSFYQPLPFVAGGVAVVVLDGNVVLGEVQATGHAPTVQVTAPAGGVVTGSTLDVAWSAHDDDNDALTFNVDYSSDGGATWRVVGIGLQGVQAQVDTTTWLATSNGLLRVTASDGFNRGDGVSLRFAVAPRAPLATILAPGNGERTRADLNLDLVGAGQDPEDGILAGEALSWLLDDRPVGAGSRLSLGQVAAGRHTVTLVARDRDGNTGSATVYIISRLGSTSLALPLILR